MNKPNIKFWIGYYFGLSCILHPETGRWILTGFFDDQVVCRRNIGEPDEDCMYYPISEVSFILKKINPFLFESVNDLSLFIKTKALEGYWVFEDKSVKVIFEE
ncbi:MAG: hypothetical protein LLF95_11390 [Bacteroidales bacterium]|nr:hypothetical protein [Bacteroidales bacterium]